MEDEAKHEILEAISLLADQVQDLSNDLGGVKSDVSSLKSDVSSLKSDVSSLKSDVTMIKATMVTKSYLDDKLGDLKGDMVSMLRKEDRQVGRLVEVLTDKKVLTMAESKDVRSYRPFP
ncbi:hypothetical protein HZC53_00295 [Candidatus Uhrbacteria bacterium]|nr:hypothetical protein [Candidatus Uhrbacteria bacterium]